jgi:hypothetical protein
VVEYAGYTTLGLLCAGFVAVAVWILVLRRASITAVIPPRSLAA